MKAVALVCLLSLSLCLTQAADKVPDNKSPSQAPVITTEKAPLTTPKPEEKKNASLPAVDDKTHKDVTNTTEKSSKAVTPVDNNTTKVENKTETPVSSSTEAATTPKPKNETTTLKPDITTANVTTVKPTVAPTATDKPAVQARGFDGPSFIGGIILTLGLLAIGFMGFKYYKNQTERNYHTL